MSQTLFTVSSNASPTYPEFMNNNFYKKHLFIPDIVLVSVWALFAARYSLDASICVIAIILLRVGLCFQMRDHSKWVFYSACTFLFAYIYVPGNSCFEYATQSMGYHIWYLFDVKGALSTYTESRYSYPSNWILALQVFWIVWNMILPIIVGIVQLRKYHKKQILKTSAICFIVSAIEIAIYCAFYRNSNIISVSIILFAIIPYLKWILSTRELGIKRITSDKDFIIYTSIIVIALAAVIIGLREVYLLRPIALMAFPIFIYYAFVTSVHSTPRLYSCALVISGFAFWLSLQSPFAMKIVCMIISIFIIILVGAKMINDLQNKIVVFLFIISIPCLLYPTICGYNPYTVLHAENTRPFLKNICTRNGLFVTEKDGKYGLRNRYGELLSPQYERFEILDASGRIMSVELEDSSFNPCYGIYDLKKQKFIVNPDSLIIRNVGRYGGDRYLLYTTYNEDDGDVLAQLVLPGYYKDEYYSDPHFEPYIEEESLPLEYFLGCAYITDDICDWRGFENLEFKDKYIKDVFIKFVQICRKKDTPGNDLNKGIAFKIFIEESPYYNGNVDSALTDVKEILIPLINEDPSLYQLYMKDISKIKMTLSYNDIASINYDAILNEYRTYYNLCNAIYNGYYDHLSWTWIHGEAMQRLSAKMGEIYSNRTLDLHMETNLWKNRSTNIEVSKTSKNIQNLNDLLKSFAPTTDDPYEFNKTYMEIHTALNEWYKSRCVVADKFDGERRRQYITITKQILARHYDDISTILSGKSL